MSKYFVIIFIFLLSACGNAKKAGKNGTAETLTGAGATFPLPYYNLAFKTYKDTTGLDVTYGGIGSGGGIRSLKDKIVDFAGSDAFLSDKEAAGMPAEVVHIPTCLGAVVLAYNLPGVTTLRLNGKTVADIYLGRITRWNDPDIQALNTGTILPDLPVHPVYRSDGSGTTYVFSDYLSKVDTGWQTAVGCGKALKWPAGIAAKGNPGVAGTISQTQGAIGYIGSEYAFALNIPVASLQNKAGNFISPGPENISAAAGGELAGDTRTMITDSDAAEAYPVSCFTWIILYKEQAYAGRQQTHAEALTNLLAWMLSDEAQALTTRVHYSPLPEKARQQAKLLLRSVTFNGQPLLK